MTIFNIRLHDNLAIWENQVYSKSDCNLSDTLVINECLYYLQETFNNLVWPSWAIMPVVAFNGSFSADDRAPYYWGSNFFYKYQRFDHLGNPVNMDIARHPSAEVFFDFLKWTDDIAVRHDFARPTYYVYTGDLLPVNIDLTTDATQLYNYPWDINRLYQQVWDYVRTNSPLFMKMYNLYQTKLNLPIDVSDHGSGGILLNNDAGYQHTSAKLSITDNGEYGYTDTIPYVKMFPTYPGGSVSELPPTNVFPCFAINATRRKDVTFNYPSITDLNDVFDTSIIQPYIDKLNDDSNLTDVDFFTNFALTTGVVTSYNYSGTYFAPVFGPLTDGRISFSMSKSYLILLIPLNKLKANNFYGSKNVSQLRFYTMTVTGTSGAVNFLTTPTAALASNIIAEYGFYDGPTQPTFVHGGHLDTKYYIKKTSLDTLINSTFAPDFFQPLGSAALTTTFVTANVGHYPGFGILDGFAHEINMSFDNQCLDEDGHDYLIIRLRTDSIAPLPIIDFPVIPSTWDADHEISSAGSASYLTLSPFWFDNTISYKDIGPPIGDVPLATQRPIGDKDHYFKQVNDLKPDLAVTDSYSGHSASKKLFYVDSQENSYCPTADNVSKF